MRIAGGKSPSNPQTALGYLGCFRQLPFSGLGDSSELAGAASGLDSGPKSQSVRSVDRIGGRARKCFVSGSRGNVFRISAQWTSFIAHHAKGRRRSVERVNCASQRLSSNRLNWRVWTKSNPQRLNAATISPSDRSFVRGLVSRCSVMSSHTTTVSAASHIDDTRARKSSSKTLCMRTRQQTARLK